MTHGDFRLRCQAETAQLQFRIYGLEDTLVKYVNGELGFEPKTPIEVLELQLRHMKDYLTILRARNAIEGIQELIVERV